MTRSAPLAYSLAAALAAALLSAGLSAQSSSPTLTVKGMPADAPLTVTASHDSSTLRITADLKAGWHLYGRDVGGGQPVAVTITGGVFAAAGELTTPMDKQGLITGKAVLTLPLRRTSEGDTLAATVAFMVCDALQCLPPIELEVRTVATSAPAPSGPFRVLLVAVDDGERTQRIAAFLLARGLTPTVTTYALVTSELCDANEVVLADSPTFNQVRGKKINARAFPKTQSPVVAIGFLGTQVLEANKVTMACGYI